MTPIELYDTQYQMELRGGGDIWRLNGKVFNHPRFENGALVQPTAPVYFDEATDCFTTVSGSVYKIMSYLGDPEKVKQQILEDIERGGYEVVDMPRKWGKI